MAKKTSLLKKGKPTMPGDPPPTKIKDTLVGDPSISFTVELNAEMLPLSPDGYYVEDFNAKLYLTDIPQPSKDDLVNVANIYIKSLSSLNPYFNVSFGDPDYGAGQQFYFFLKLSGTGAVSKQPIKFNDFDNWFAQSLIGGGIVQTFLEGKKATIKLKGRKK